MVECVMEEAGRRGIWLHAASLVDDLLAVTAPEHMDEVVQIVAEKAAEVLHTALNLDKCKAYVPACSQEGEGTHPAITSIEQVSGGLPALGAAYGGTYEAVLGPYTLASEPARKRLEAARSLAQECANYAVESHAPSTLQSAWCIVQKCAARALQYDLRVLEPAESKPVAAELDRLVGESAEKLLGPLGGEWGLAQRAQLTWPASLSGMGMGSAALGARVGRVGVPFPMPAHCKETPSEDISTCERGSNSQCCGARRC